MSRRRYNLPQPVDAEHVTGEGYEFKPEDDLVNAGKPLPPPVQLIPSESVVGDSVFELKPEDDKVAQPEPPADPSEPRT
jgi:hypothetical protein